MNERDDKRGEGEPIFLNVGKRHELCRFPRNGEWSLRIKQDDDVAHVRYLNELEVEMVEAALAFTPSHVAPKDDVIEILTHLCDQAEGMTHMLYPEDAAAMGVPCTERARKYLAFAPSTTPWKPRGAYVPLTEAQIENWRGHWKNAPTFTDDAVNPAEIDELDRLCNMAINCLLYAQEIDRLRTTPSATACTGSKLVPEQPTESMIEAGVKDTRAYISHADAEEIYKAMLRFAPNNSPDGGKATP